MKQEDKELLLLDLCARLPYGVKVQAVSVYGYTVQVPIDGYCSSDNRFDIDLRWRTVDEFKPYLRPMSSMTDDERKEYKDIVKNTIDFYDCPKSEEICFFIIPIDWLNSHYFDYRGLIEKGLAIEATEDMYKLTK